MYVKGANLGFCLKEGPYHVVNLLVLFFPIFLGILSFVPKAQIQNLVRFSRRNQNDLIHEASLFFQDRHRSVIDGVGKLLRFSTLAGHFHYACEHILAPFSG